MKIKRVTEKKNVKYPSLMSYLKGVGFAGIIAGVGYILIPNLRTAGKMTSLSSSAFGQLQAIKTACETFYTEYNQYPKTVNDLTGKGNSKINTRNICFYSAEDMDDFWSPEENDFVNVLIDSDYDGTADTLMTGEKVGKLSPKDAGIEIEKGKPIIVYTNKGEENDKILSTLED